MMPFNGTRVHKPDPSGLAASILETAQLTKNDWLVCDVSCHVLYTLGVDKDTRTMRKSFKLITFMLSERKNLQ